MFLTIINPLLNNTAITNFQEKIIFRKHHVAKCWYLNVAGFGKDTKILFMKICIFITHLLNIIYIFIIFLN